MATAALLIWEVHQKKHQRDRWRTRDNLEANVDGKVLARLLGDVSPAEIWSMTFTTSQLWSCGHSRPESLKELSLMCPAFSAGVKAKVATEHTYWVSTQDTSTHNPKCSIHLLMHIDLQSNQQGKIST